MKTIISTIAVFILSTLVLSVLYVSTFGTTETIGLATLKNVVLRYGTVLSVPLSFAWILITVLVRKITNKWIAALSVIIILVLLYYVLAYLYLWYVAVATLIDNPFVD